MKQNYYPKEILKKYFDEFLQNSIYESFDEFEQSERSDSYLDESNLLEIVDKNDFSIGPYGEYTASTYVCHFCGSDKFIVGAESYFTCIKCPNCGYEIDIHTG